MDQKLVFRQKSGKEHPVPLLIGDRPDKLSKRSKPSTFRPQPSAELSLLLSKVRRFPIVANTKCQEGILCPHLSPFASFLYCPIEVAFFF